MLSFSLTLNKTAFDLSPQRTGPTKASAKASCAQKAKPAAVQVVPPAPRVQGPAEPVPSVPEGPADASMKEEELCQAFSEALLSVQDVDEQDADLPQLCSEYVKDIYNYLHLLEVIYSSTQTKSLLFFCISYYNIVPPRRCSRLYEPTTCRVMKSPSACGLF